MLSKQINVLSVDTGNFYSNNEQYLHRLNNKVRVERNEVKKQIQKLTTELIESGLTAGEVKAILTGGFDFTFLNENLKKIALKLVELSEAYKHKTEKAKETKTDLLAIMANKVDSPECRQLRFFNTAPTVVSVFDSAFTRMIGADAGELNEDFIIVQVYYFDVIKDIIYNGFIYKGEKYIYFTSSAGQIRTKKCVFVKESVYKKYEKTIMCGLTLEKINEKGGNVINKHLAYLALLNSATDLWNEFDIDKVIVVEDFETDVYGTYDLIDDVDYSITRKDGCIPVPHTDGCGMILPTAFNKSQKNMMIRLPWIKGLLGVFDFVKFIEENNCSPVIKDIYGKEHNVISEGIQVILTKSQFKLWKFYDSWEQYKEYYKKYNCTAGVANIEENRIPNASINYQMLQTLTDITDEEIQSIIQSSIDRVKHICDTTDNIKEVLKATDDNEYKSAFQKAIILYPELMNDVYVRTKIKELKDSMVKDYKSGKLRVKGKYTFILPDLYAACEFWFMGIAAPEGLLKDGEVFCNLFKASEELDCLRSPHLYKEHAVRKNLAFTETEKQASISIWFTTDALYTSTHDLISKILMHDCDGDKSLVVSDKTIIKVAKRNMKDIVPLYYNMKKAPASKINNKTIYDGLTAAFTGGNIGMYSNSISKIWNNEVFVSGTDEEKQKAIDAVKLLCMENNFVVDYAKTLYKPVRPKEKNQMITALTKSKLPYFFKYAKDKEADQIEAGNESFVNKLDYLIKNPRISFMYLEDNKKQKLSKPDYKLLMCDSSIEVTAGDPVIKAYAALVAAYEYKLSNKEKVRETIPREHLHKTEIVEKVMYSDLIQTVKARLSATGYTDTEIADILVKYLYDIKDSKNKNILWLCYGDILYENLVRNIQLDLKEVKCADCGSIFKMPKSNHVTKRCKLCTTERKRIQARERIKRFRGKQ